MNDVDNERSEWIVDTTQVSFQEDVFERSKKTLVVVDFGLRGARHARCWPRYWKSWRRKVQASLFS